MEIKVTVVLKGINVKGIMMQKKEETREEQMQIWN